MRANGPFGTSILGLGFSSFASGRARLRPAFVGTLKRAVPQFLPTRFGLERTRSQLSALLPPKKLKTTGRALPVVLEVYHKGRGRLLETKLPPNDLIGYLSKTIHN